MAAILPSATPRHGKVLDRVGATGSMLCAAHCAALPLVLAIAPAIGAGFASRRFEIGFIAFASVLGMTSLILGYRLHRVGRALALLAPGIALLWCAVGVESLHENVIAHAVAMACGGSLVAVAHLLNLRLTHGHLHVADCADCPSASD